MQLAAISPAAVRDWYADLLPGKPAMRAQTYPLLRTIFNTALANELVDANPCRVRGAGSTTRQRRSGRPRWPSLSSSLRRSLIG